MILLDTNFLMIPHGFGVDVISQIKDRYPEKKLVTLRQVESELHGLTNNDKK